MGRILMYSTDGCRHCVRATQILLANGCTEDDIVKINVATYPSRKAEMQTLTKGKKTVPQVFFNEEYIGGATDVAALEEAGTLADKVKEVLAGETPSYPVPPVGADTSSAGASAAAAAAGGGSGGGGDGGEDAAEKPKETAAERKARRAAEKRAARLVELDSLHDRLRDPRVSPLMARIRDRRKGLRSVKRVVFGRDLLVAVAEVAEVSAELAVAECQSLMRHGYISCVKAGDPVDFDKRASEATLYRFSCDSDPWVLNLRRRVRPGRKLNAVSVAAGLQQRMVHMADRFLTEDGRGVDYAALHVSDEFSAYVAQAVELQAVDLTVLSDIERKAFFINCYNAMVIHANIVRGPPTSMLARAQFFSKVTYLIGGSTFSLNDIEHGVLRGNKKPIGINTKVPFRGQDPRLKLVVPLDPRVHFALVCGAKGCPPIRVVDDENLDTALDWAAEGFCDEEVVMKEGAKGGWTATLSQIFKWYGSDFGPDRAALLTWVGERVSEDHLLRKALKAAGGAKAIKVKYASYDWSLNNDRPEVNEDAVYASATETSASELSVDTDMTFDATSESGEILHSAGGLLAPRHAKSIARAKAASQTKQRLSDKGKKSTTITTKPSASSATTTESATFSSDSRGKDEEDDDDDDDDVDGAGDGAADADAKSAGKKEGGEREDDGDHDDDRGADERAGKKKKKNDTKAAGKVKTLPNGTKVVCDDEACVVVS